MHIILSSTSPRVTQDHLMRMQAALQETHERFCMQWEIIPDSISLFGVASATDVVSAIFAEKVDDPNALAYHTENADGTRVILVNVPLILDRLGGDVLSSPNGSCCGALDHEIKENKIDPSVQLWADTFKNTEIAYEVCDPVQNTRQAVVLADSTIVDVSAYVLPCWFDPQAKGGQPFDSAGVLNAPFSIAKDGYVVLRKSMEATSQQWGERLSLMKANGASFSTGDRGVVVFGEKFPEHKRDLIRNRVQQRLQARKA